MIIAHKNMIDDCISNLGKTYKCVREVDADRGRYTYILQEGENRRMQSIEIDRWGQVGIYISPVDEDECSRWYRVDMEKFISCFELEEKQ